METELIDKNSDGNAETASYGGLEERRNEHASDQDTSSRWQKVYYLSWVSFVVLIILGVSSIALGKIYDRASVFAFGFSALLDGACAGVVLWRSRSIRQGCLSADRSQRHELVAEFILATIFLAASVIILANSIKGLFYPAQVTSVVLLTVSAIGGLVEIIFCIFKIHLGRKLQSQAVLADGINSLVCGVLGLSVIPAEVIGGKTKNGSADHILGIIVGSFVCVYGLVLCYLVLSNHVTRNWISDTARNGIWGGSSRKGS